MFGNTSIIILFVCSLTVSLEYNGYKIYKISPKSVGQSLNLYRLSQQHDGLDALHLPRVLNKSAHIMVAPGHQHGFESNLKNLALNYTILVDDVATSLQNNAISSKAFRAQSNGIGFTQYYRYAEINKFLDQLAVDNPKNVEVKTVGTSYEDRAMKTIRISNGDGKRNKKVIFVDAGLHAREWIAPAAALYIINQLVANKDANADLLESYDWLILPLVNPDGYEYTHTRNRMWRKTRSWQGTCFGTDGNRNFDYKWGTIGASSSSCADTYRGPKAFSEPETRILRDILLSLKGRGKFYLSLHSYGNYILYPWGWTSQLPAKYKDMDEVAAAGAQAIRAVTGGRYTYGSSARVMYAAAGSSKDYAHVNADFPISITMELPAGGTGFDPRPSQIQGFVKEAWIGIKAMAQKVIAKY